MKARGILILAAILVLLLAGCAAWLYFTGSPWASIIGGGSLIGALAALGKGGKRALHPTLDDLSPYSRDDIGRVESAAVSAALDRARRDSLAHPERKGVLERGVDSGA